MITGKDRDPGYGRTTHSIGYKSQFNDKGLSGGTNGNLFSESYRTKLFGSKESNRKITINKIR